MPAIDKDASDFDKANTKVSKLKRLVRIGEYNADLARYIPGTLELAFQGMLDDIKTMEQVAHPSYKDLETFDFNLILHKNLYMNLNSLHFFFPLKIKKKTNMNSDRGVRFNYCKSFFCILDKGNKYNKVWNKYRVNSHNHPTRNLSILRLYVKTLT